MRRWLAPFLGLAAAPAYGATPATVQDYMSQAAVAPDARIAYGEAPQQVVELFLPKTKPQGRLPVVVLIHGGCYLAEYQGLPQTSPMAAALAAQGYAVWNVEYRKLGESGSGYPGTFLDVGAAVDRLRDEAGRYSLDLEKVVAVGHSAGGHLALWAAGRAKLSPASPLWKADPLKIRTVVSLGGIGDLEGQGTVFSGACGAEPLGKVIGLADRSHAYADTSPAELLPLGVRVVMISGAFDHVMPPFTGLAFVERLRAAGDSADVAAIQDAGHYDVVIPTTPAWKMVVEAVDREIDALD